MMFQKFRTVTNVLKCAISLTSARKYQVTIVGAAGAIGQPLSMYLKANPLVTRLILHDLQKQTPGVSLDLSHIPSMASVEGFVGADKLETALTNANIVVMCGGIPRKPGMKREELFDQNAKVIADLMAKITKCCPCAFIAIITNPVNSLVPLAAEALKSSGLYDQRKLFGVTTLDLVRAQTCYAQAACIDPACVSVPVIGGHSDTTMVPVFSMAMPSTALAKEKVKELVDKVRTAGSAVVEAKGQGSASLSMAYAANQFLKGLLEALAGSPNVQYAYIQNNDFGTCFFAGPVTIDSNGAFEMQCFPALGASECCLLEAAIDELRKDVLRGQVKFCELKSSKAKPC